MSEGIVCHVCPHHCRLREGDTGRCHARGCKNDTSVSLNYGKVTSIALDPVEKKPLAFFCPGSYVLSVGSFGCNMSCPFCQNYDISTVGEDFFRKLYHLSPEELVTIASDHIPEGNIGVAYTYNEAMVGYEYVRDCAKLVHDNGMKNVLVTNGMVELPVLEEVLPYIDAMNIDLKCFTVEGYERLGGDLETVKSFIRRSAEESHIEITSLIIPGLNDSPEEMDEEAEWISGIDPGIPLHITRYFPRYKMMEKATDIELMKRLKSAAEKHLSRVLLGNI
ncbi:MAG: AmmeMemoRadiSam system radical SAM enzyme [Lachnospiraceae bacterium]|nr:AmmeMemoRadiSam system radical SAM enzyme [Lachnospiraceae bacterium]